MWAEGRLRRLKLVDPAAPSLSSVKLSAALCLAHISAARFLAASSESCDLLAASAAACVVSSVSAKGLVRKEGNQKTSYKKKEG